MNFRLIKSLFLLFVVDPSEMKEKREIDFLLRKQGWPSKSDEFFQMKNREAIIESSFDASKPTIFLIHGYLEDNTTPRHQRLSSALLETEDQNLFFVDWGSVRKSFWYPEAVERVPEIAKVVADFIDFMVNGASLELEKTTIIGFSLGAHIAGLAAKRITGGKVNKIIGLDPAGPGFLVEYPQGRLDANDANYVECIHTGYILGIREPICQVDFYINGGRDQPGCETIFGTFDVICSHARAVEIFRQASYAKEAFFGNRCESLDEVFGRNCHDTSGAFLNGKQNYEEKMSGIFHISTSDIEQET